MVIIQPLEITWSKDINQIPLVSEVSQTHTFPTTITDNDDTRLVTPIKEYTLRDRGMWRYRRLPNVMNLWPLWHWGNRILRLHSHNSGLLAKQMHVRIDSSVSVWFGYHWDQRHNLIQSNWHFRCDLFVIFVMLTCQWDSWISLTRKYE